VPGPPKGNLGLGKTLGRPPQSRKKGPRLYRLRPHFAHFLAKKAQKWQKSALAGMAHPPKRGNRAHMMGAFGPCRPWGVADRPTFATIFPPAPATPTISSKPPNYYPRPPLHKNSCQMMSAATFFGLKGPKAPFFWARFPRFGGCAIPAGAVFCHFWAFFAKK
jgi:hypothetical protein